MSDKTVEQIARIITPFWWMQYDNALRPFVENRGAYSRLGEAWIYADSYGRKGFRKPEQVSAWIKDGEVELCTIGQSLQVHVQGSLKKAQEIVALLGEQP